MTHSGIITLLTDFGTVDGYVGAMKGVILCEAPSAHIVDITHDVPPQDVSAGARALETAAPWFPRGTIHVAVVDPGVGSARRPIAVRAFGQLFIGPDNGLLSAAIATALPSFASEARGVPREAGLPAHAAAVRVLDTIPPEWHLSSTFHGRDLFARVAACIAAGAPLDDYSRTVAEHPVQLAEPAARAVAGWQVAGQVASQVIEGEVVHVDRFGNLVSNIDVEALRGVLPPEPGAPLADGAMAGRFTVEIAGRSLPLCTTYADVAAGAPLAYVGSSRRIEIAVRDGSAVERFAVGRGERLRVRAA